MTSVYRRIGFIKKLYCFSGSEFVYKADECPFGHFFEEPTERVGRKSNLGRDFSYGNALTIIVVLRI